MPALARLALPTFLTSTLALAVAVCASPRNAAAEPSASFTLGGGYSVQRNGFTHANDGAAAISMSAGVGTRSDAPLVIGGIARFAGYFTQGIDIGLGARLSTGGFARGDWGVALDAGVAGRFWREQAYGHFPVQVFLTGGAPWGFQVAVGTDFWDVSGDTPKARGYVGLLEIDLLRLTVYRTGATTSYWPNPAPPDASEQR